MYSATTAEGQWACVEAGFVVQCSECSAAPAVAPLESVDYDRVTRSAQRGRERQPAGPPAYQNDRLGSVFTPGGDALFLPFGPRSAREASHRPALAIFFFEAFGRQAVHELKALEGLCQRLTTPNSSKFLFELEDASASIRPLMRRRVLPCEVAKPALAVLCFAPFKAAISSAPGTL